MKKTSKLLALVVTSLTVMSGCKGSKITNEEAKDVVSNIAEESAKIYAEGKLSFTAEVEMTMTIEGEESEAKTELEYDAENKALYAYVYAKDGEETEELEYYCGLKDGVYYYFDELKEEYYTVEGNAAELAWATNESYLAFPAGVSAQILTALTGYIAAEDENVTFYSSGEGNLYVEYKYEEDGEKVQYDYEFKDNLVTKEIIKGSDEEGNKVNSKTTLKYKASVKLPSTKGYTKKSL